MEERQLTILRFIGLMERSNKAVLLSLLLFAILALIEGILTAAATQTLNYYRTGSCKPPDNTHINVVLHKVLINGLLIWCSASSLMAGFLKRSLEAVTSSYKLFGWYHNLSELPYLLKTPHGRVQEQSCLRKVFFFDIKIYMVEQWNVSRHPDLRPSERFEEDWRASTRGVA